MTYKNTQETEEKAAVDLPRLVRLRAFRISCGAIHPVVHSVCMAKSAAAAKYRCWASAKEAGYDIGFACFKVRRSPEYDHLEKLRHGRVYGEDYAIHLSQANNPDHAQKCSDIPPGERNPTK